VPAGRILEIAPGFGRWTKYLLAAAKVDYFGVDLSEECIKHCRHIFDDARNATFEQNDGLSLEMVPDASVDFVFSFDSLVHVERNVMESYIPQIVRKLTPKGIAFIHHSNWLQAGQVDKNNHSRGESVSAKVVQDLVGVHHGVVLLQEMLNWGDTHLIDCFSIFGRSDSYSECVTEIIQNPRFMEEASIIRDVLSPYARLPIGV
jgi:SAM-dependent methyltransferase